jgi:hypothetical protein
MKLVFTTDITGEDMYAIIQRAYDGYWYNTVDSEFDSPETTIDGSFDPYVTLTEGSSGSYSSNITLPNGQYVMHLYQFRGAGDYDHELDTEIPLWDAKVTANSEIPPVEEDDLALVTYAPFLEDRVADNETDITTLDTEKIEADDVDAASIGPFITNILATEPADGSNPIFNFPEATGIIAGSEIVTVAGLQKIRTIDYTIVGTTVTFEPGSIPSAGEPVVINCCIAATWS